MRNLRLTVIQSEIIWHSPGDNIKLYGSLVDEIAGATDFVLLPEMFTTGFTMDPEKIACDMNGEAVAAMISWSRALNAFVAGSIIIKENNMFFNRFIAVSPAGELFHYDKRHLFRMAGEDKVYTSGSENIIIDIMGWKVRPFVCYDLRFPVWSRNPEEKYDLAVYVANWPAVRSLHWETLLRARAIENQCYVAGVNRTGIDGNRVKYSGGSSVIGFRGEELYNAGDKPDVHTVELPYRELAEYRQGFPAWMDADRFRVL
ncbi:MAG TPA: amidohydrolase [Spirochaetota bacterium]|nr:amidohydrolase [Spirochaetota bacterium]HPJ34918.1 amidohydrolase [Spirochaetota bacterium]